MTTVGVRKLKNRLSEYLRIAQAGERVTVTSRGTPVADLVPHAPRGQDPDDELLRLARAGEVRLCRPNAAVDYARPPREQRLPHEEVMALLDWARSDR